MPARIVEGRDHWYHRLMQDAPFVCAPEPMDAIAVFEPSGKISFIPKQ